MRYLLLLTIVLAFGSVHSQKYNHWSVDANLGLNTALGPFTEGYQSNYFGLYHADANVRYMFTNKFGVMAGMGFDRIKHDATGVYQSQDPFKVHYIRLSFQSVFDLGRIAEFEQMHERFSALLHAGLGFSSLKDAHRSVWLSPFRTQGTDEMMHFMIGVTPQVRIKDYIAVHLDFTYIVNAWQTIPFDFATPHEFQKGVDGKMVTWSVGASYYFGKSGQGKRHLDWVITKPSGAYASNQSARDTIITRETIKTVETIRIVEKDSSSNQNNLTKPESYSPGDDFDGDGVPNGKDHCPTTPGNDPNGCPNADRDGDGIVNSIDDCPDVKGILENGGCPGIDLATKRILNEAMREVNFEEHTPDLLEESNSHLDKIVQLLNEHPEYMMHLEGHTNNQGEAGPLKSLSEARAQAIKDYLVAAGIAEERISTEGLGDTKPIAYNDSPSGRDQNERIEFKIRFQ